MANNVTQILHPSGSKSFRDKGPGLISVKYWVNGDGVGSTVNLPYGLISKLLWFEGASPTVVLTDDPSNKRVTAVIPAAQPNGKNLLFQLVGLP